MEKIILIVEDNEANMALLKSVLSIRGYRIIEAVNGEEAIAKARAHHPDLILMDLQMPVMDGYEATARIKADADAGGVKIIAVTSFAMAGDRQKALDAGADDYIPKPINTRDLPMLVSRHLKLS